MADRCFVVRRGLKEKLGLSSHAAVRSPRLLSVDRWLCQCSSELVKPKHRLQRLFQSLQTGEVSPDNGTAGKVSHVPYSPAEMAELTLLINLLPTALQKPLLEREDLSSLVEVVLDLGRPPAARFNVTGDVELSDKPLSRYDLKVAVEQVGNFSDDNRAGIDGTLHRISCIRNRDQHIVGLTLRVGRAVQGCANLAADFAKSGKSILIMGKPGLGKTTAIRELSRYLADEVKKRVVIVDSSNEIGGDGDVPHRGVGSCRRLQVRRTTEQHAVMIEAVENHTPEVIVIDEIGNKMEALAARTISQRGVQLIATAHGHSLENLLQNPSLVELLGGIQTVTIGDEVMKYRGLQRKTTRERAAPPSFDVAIEMVDRHSWRVYSNVTAAVDLLLADRVPSCETRELNTHDFTVIAGSFHPKENEGDGQPLLPRGKQTLSVCPVGLDSDQILAARTAIGKKAERLRIVFNLEFADVVLALRSQMRPKSPAREAARNASVPVYAVKTGSSGSLIRALQTLLGIPATLKSSDNSDDEGEEEPKNHVVSLTMARNEQDAYSEARSAVQQVVKTTSKPIELLPRSPGIVEKQAALLKSEYPEHPVEILGSGLQRRIRILPSSDWNVKEDRELDNRKTVFS